MENIFVYGTLLFEDEDPSHGIDTTHYILESKQAWIKGKLYAVEGFPFLVQDGDDQVKGKMFICENIDVLLERYDKIEGVTQEEPFFERKIVEVYLGNGTVEKAYCYVAGNKLKECFAKEKYHVKSGDWTNAL